MNTPLADLIRPKALDEVVGQQHLIGNGKPLRRIIESGHIPNMIFTVLQVQENYSCENYC